MPFSAALIADSPPTNCILPLLLPVPASIVKPAVLDNEIRPLDADKSTTKVALAASASATLIRLLLAVLKVSRVFSATACAPGTVHCGASFCAATLTVTVRAAVSGPPAPLLPRSLTLTCTEPAPAKFRFGSKRSPSSAVLMLLSEPVKLIVVFDVPLPTVKLKPITPARDNLPLLAASVTWIGLAPASASLIAIKLPLPVEK